MKVSTSVYIAFAAAELQDFATSPSTLSRFKINYYDAGLLHILCPLLGKFP